MTKPYKPSTYGDRIAEYYDDWVAHALPQDLDQTVDVLRDLAGAGPILELGIGTGRIALPLAESGVEVHGIDASERMVAELRKKSGGAEIPVRMGDFSSFDLGQQFSLVFVVFNTFFALLTEEAQRSCFRSVAAHLHNGGRFLLEVFVPDLSRFDRGQRVSVRRIETDLVQIDAALLDEQRQQINSQHIVITESGTRLLPVQLRFAWPEQLDQMAAEAGLALENRWSSWNREQFNQSSGMHISVYKKG